MKGKSTLSLFVAGFILVGVSPVFADYSVIQDDLMDGLTDTTFVGGVLRIQQSDMDYGLTLTDTGLGSPNMFRNIDVDMSTPLVSFVAPSAAYPRGYAEFGTGSLLLTFEYSEDGLSWRSSSIGGPVAGFRAQVQSEQVIKGEGLFTASWDLPGSNVWPASGFSSIHTIELHFGTDLIASNFQFASDLTDGETLYTLVPDASAAPEPAGLLLLGLGAIGFLGRRRK